MPLFLGQNVVLQIYMHWCIIISESLIIILFGILI